MRTYGFFSVSTSLSASIAGSIAGSIAFASALLFVGCSCEDPDMHGDASALDGAVLTEDGSVADGEVLDGQARDAEADGASGPACRFDRDCHGDTPSCVDGACVPCVESDCTHEEAWREYAEAVCDEGREQAGDTDYHDAMTAAACSGRREIDAYAAYAEGLVRQGIVELASDTPPECARIDSASIRDPYCALFWHGTIEDGGGCRTGIECQSQRCDFARAGACEGVCAPLSVKDEPCEGTAQCEGNLRCVEGTCALPVAEGGACTWQEACSEGLVCTAAGTCEAKLTEGSACDDDSGVNQCRDGLFCVEGRCRDLPAAGELCWPRRAGPERCQEGLRCVADVCRAPSADGARCEVTMECAAGSRCHEGTCHPIATARGACDATTLCPLGRGCVGGRCAPLPSVGEPCAEAGCLRGTCIDGRCANLPAGTACTPSEQLLDLFDPCGSEGSCRETSSGHFECVAEGGLGASCSDSGPSCRAPELECDGETHRCATPCLLR